MMTGTAVEPIPALDHEQAMSLAAAEYAQVLALVDAMTDRQWSAPTDCTGWDVRAVVGHLLGMAELLADPAEAKRQGGLAAGAAARSGDIALNELTALQVREHAHLSRVELKQALADATGRALTARSATTAERRAAPYPVSLPGEKDWTIGYLFDVIHNRDPWMHRVDIHHATGTAMNLSAEHDGRIVADVVAEWARRHRQSFTLNLTGVAGGTYRAGDGGPEFDLDAVEFCRILSGRAPATGLLTTTVPF